MSGTITGLSIPKGDVVAVNREEYRELLQRHHHRHVEKEVAADFSSGADRIRIFLALNDVEFVEKLRKERQDGKNAVVKEA